MADTSTINSFQDGFCPLGPCIVSTEKVPDPSVFRLETTLNDQLMQNGSADDMIFSIPEIVSYLSQVSLHLDRDILY